MRVFLAVVVFSTTAWGASVSVSSLTVFVPEDHPKAWTADDLTSHPLLIVYKSLSSPGHYRAAVSCQGLSDMSSAKYRDVADLLHTTANKRALYLTDLRAFNNSGLHQAPMRAGDPIVLPCNFQLQDYANKLPPVLFLGDILDFDKFQLRQLKEVGRFEIYPDILKTITHHR